MNGDEGVDLFAQEMKTQKPRGSLTTSFSKWNIHVGDYNKNLTETNPLFVYQDPTVMASSRRHKFYRKWFSCYTSRGTPANFFCAIFYVAICSVLFTAYFWQYPTQPLSVSLLDVQHEAIIRGLKTINGLPTANVTTRERDGENKLTTPSLSQGINATEAPLTSPAIQPMEPKNWAGGGYHSIPGFKPLPKHCNTCALVTSSGHLKGSKLGTNIDSADCVIRMNAAPTLKYETDVGSRTTFRVIGHRNFPSMFKKEESQEYYLRNTTTKSDYTIVTWLYGVDLKKNTPYRLCQVLAKRFKGFKCYLGTEETMNRNLDLFYNELGISRNKIKLWLSTGWTTLLFALEVCDKIDVYGMVYDGYCDEHPKDKTLYHYYDKVRSECSYYARSEKKAASGHKFLTEKAIIAKWANIYNMTFHRPSWEGHLARQNLSSAIDSPYKRIYHYLQWKEEHDKSNKTSKEPVSDQRNESATKEKPANVTIRNKPPPKDRNKHSNIEPVLNETPEDDTEDKRLDNETMKSENIVAIKLEDAEGVMVVDRETGVAVKVPNQKQPPKGTSIKQKSRSKNVKKKTMVKKTASKADLEKKRATDRKSKSQPKTSR